MDTDCCEGRASVCSVQRGLLSTDTNFRGWAQAGKRVQSTENISKNKYVLIMWHKTAKTVENLLYNYPILDPKFVQYSKVTQKWKTMPIIVF